MTRHDWSVLGVIGISALAGMNLSARFIQRFEDLLGIHPSFGAEVIRAGARRSSPSVDSRFSPHWRSHGQPVIRTFEWTPVDPIRLERRRARVPSFQPREGMSRIEPGVLFTPSDRLLRPEPAPGGTLKLEAPDLFPPLTMDPRPEPAPQGGSSGDASRPEPAPGGGSSG